MVSSLQPASNYQDIVEIFICFSKFDLEIPYDLNLDLLVKSVKRLEVLFLKNTTKWQE